jgi:ABC-type dipeptide/oligopeptide/nickel transport system permease component
MGFDQPLVVQFWKFLTHAVRGDFGQSLQYHEPGLRLVFERLPATVELTAAALIVALGLAIPLGIISAVKRNSLVDNAALFLALFGQSMPIFWLGILLILIVSVRLDLLPSSGSGSLAHLVLPGLTLGLYTTARLTRVVRAEMLDVLGQDYLRTAYAKGVKSRTVVIRHAFRNALLPVVTMIGLEMGSMLGGAVITETVFAWPGVGQLVVNAIYNRDYPIVQAAVFVIALVFVTINLVVDILYTVIDPRVSH